jgi:hypothetical protein
MKAHGITNPWDLTEFDQWVNDAIRTDINTVAEQHNYEVFGLEMWKWKKIRGRDLIHTLNFSVDLIFKNQDEPKVDSLIQRHKRRKWSMKADKRLIDKLFAIALISCTWV